jgi:hypothetical protein
MGSYGVESGRGGWSWLVSWRMSGWVNGVLVKTLLGVQKIEPQAIDCNHPGSKAGSNPASPTHQRRREMKLALVMVDDLWKGLVEIEGELFKVTLWPGSATTEWKASLQPHLFVELTEGQPIANAIEVAKKRLGQDVTQIPSTPPEADLLRMVRDNPELLKEILEALNGTKEG